MLGVGEIYIVVDRTCRQKSPFFLIQRGVIGECSQQHLGLKGDLQIDTEFQVHRSGEFRFSSQAVSVLMSVI